MGDAIAISINHSNSYPLYQTEISENDTVSNELTRKEKRIAKKLAKQEKRRKERERRREERRLADELRQIKREEKKATRKNKDDHDHDCDCGHHHNHEERDSVKKTVSVSAMDKDTTTKKPVVVAKPVAKSEKNENLNDSLAKEIAPDSLLLDSLKKSIQSDTLKKDTIIERDEYGRIIRVKNGFLDNKIDSENSDSMVFNMSTNLMHLYRGVNLKYGESELEGSYMLIELDKDQISAFGEMGDTAYIKPLFKEKGEQYDMDSLTYNLKTGKALILGGYRKEGDGYIHGERIKLVDDKTINIKSARYTTCDCEEPHFYIASVKSQMIEGKGKKNIIAGASYLVLEGVPLYPLVIPYFFFPLMSNRNSGIIMPEVGEEGLKGFFVRDGGYYFAFNDYFDAKLTGGIYTYGSWETALSSSYKKRYRYSGSMNFDFSKVIYGEKGSEDYTNMNNYSIKWSHRQDSKFKPNSSLSASVNFSSSSYNKTSGSIEDYITAQTNSSIAYSKSWDDKPFSFSTSLQHSQNNTDSTVTLSLPNMAFNVSKIYPFKRKNAIGKQLWYEKIGFTYTGAFNNSVSTKQDMLFTQTMFDDMKYGFNHSIPVSTSITALNYLNITPSVSYQERWYFDKSMQTWNTETSSVDTTKMYGFNRIFNYSASLSFQTTIYGMYQFKSDSKVQAIRHVMTPSFSLSYAPNFGDSKYGYYKEVQYNENGDTRTYSPFSNGIYGVPGNGETGSISFSLGNTLEMKVRSERDTSGVKKVKIFESLSFSTSYNMLADSMNLSNISISARTTLFNTLGINASATYDPYEYTYLGVRTKNLGQGRITSASLSFGYSFRSVFGHEGAGSGTGSETLPRNFTPEESRYMTDNNINPMEAVSLLTPEYYNFSIPWNLSLNYNLSYSHSGLSKSVTQTVSYNGSLTLTEKWGLTFSGGLNLETLEITPGTVTIDRDLHCWQMGLTWVPVGYRKSWSFNIKVKSSVLQDLKLEKSSSYLDNYY